MCSLKAPSYGVPPAASISQKALNRATLARQMLLTREALSPVSATERLVGIQAQLARPPFVGLWSRVADLNRSEVVRDLLDKRLVRGTSLRGTLHVMSAADFLQLRGTLQPALEQGIQMLGARIDAPGIEAAVATGRAFFDEPRTFDDLRTHLTTHFPTGDIRAMAYAVRMRLPLLQVPTEVPWAFPAQADFITAERWLGALPPQDAAAADLVLRYLGAYGPATLNDVQAWSGLGGLRPVLEALRSRLLTFRGEGCKGELFDVPEAPRPAEDVPAPVRFLPEYDNAIVGRSDARLLASQHRSAVFLPGLRVAPTFLVDGFVAGTWKIERKGKAATLSLAPFETLSADARQALEQEGEALIRFAEPHAATLAVTVSSRAL